MCSHSLTIHSLLMYSVDKDEFLNFFSLVSGAMDDDTFDQVIQELFETLKGVVKVNVDPDMVPTPSTELILS